MADRSFLDWPFLEDRHRAFAADLEAWAEREAALGLHGDHDLDGDCRAILKALAAGGKYDALIALGAVIRGDTPHFEFVAGECTRGVAQVGMQYDIPVAFGVLTTDTVEQAIERAGPDSGNKGAEAALAAVEMADLLKKLRA